MEISGRAGAISMAHTEGKEAKRSKKKNRQDLFISTPLNIDKKLFCHNVEWYAKKIW
jgi:hypothetical protein